MKNQNLESIGPIPAVIYARYSSSGQREESIEGQLRDCHEYARKNNLIIVGEYIDRALTGRTDKRPDFQRMIKDSEKGLFQAVICWKMDRFARNRYDSAVYKYKLKHNNVRVVYAKEAIPDGPEGIILEGVMEASAEYYSRNLSENVKRGNYDSALELKTLGQTLLGLRKGPDGRFELDPATAPIVRRIFEEYAAGESAKNIITRLNEEGYRTSYGNPFNMNSVRGIIKNEKYAGVYQYKDFRVEGGIPAIVSRELFDKCQRMLERHRRAPAEKWPTHFRLTTKLFCGECGQPMTGDSGTSRNGNVHQYYICNHRRAHKCKKERVKKDWIENFVISQLTALIHSDQFIQGVADRVMEFQSREKDNSALHTLQKHLRANERAINNLLSAMESGIVTPSTKSRLMELETEQTRIEKAIASELIEKSEVERDQVVYFLEQFRRGDTKDEEYQNFLIDTFLNSIFLYDDGKIVLILNYTKENTKITLQAIRKMFAEKEGAGSRFAWFGEPDKSRRTYVLRDFCISEIFSF